MNSMKILYLLSIGILFLLSNTTICQTPCPQLFFQKSDTTVCLTLDSLGGLEVYSNSDAYPVQLMFEPNRSGGVQASNYYLGRVIHQSVGWTKVSVPKTNPYGIVAVPAQSCAAQPGSFQITVKACAEAGLKMVQDTARYLNPRSQPNTPVNQSAFDGGIPTLIMLRIVFGSATTSPILFRISPVFLSFCRGQPG